MEEEREGSKNIRCAQKEDAKKMEVGSFQCQEQKQWSQTGAQEAPSEHQGALMY